MQWRYAIYIIMNLLKDSVISDQAALFFHDEDQDPFKQITYKSTHYEGNKFLDSSLNGVLQSIKPSHEKAESDSMANESIIKQEHKLNESRQEMFDFPNLYQKSLYNQVQQYGAVMAQYGQSILVQSGQAIKGESVDLQIGGIEKQGTKEQIKGDAKLVNWLEKDQECVSEEFQEPVKIVKNQTKNIPKNYGKAIISFIQKHKSKLEELLEKRQVSYSCLLNELKMYKKTINTIADLRNLWTKSKYSKQMRILSGLFLRKYALQYIFNSRITNFSSHIKYRHKLRQALSYPDNFKNIKDY